MEIKKKKYIYLMLAVIVLAVVFMMFWKFSIGKQEGSAERMAACGLSQSNGEVISIRQGTVASISGIRIGLKSIQDEKVNIELFNQETNMEKSGSNLGLCESVDFDGFTVYVLNIVDRFDFPFFGSGSGNDSVDLFIKKF